METDKEDYQSIKRDLSAHLDNEIYRILSENPLVEWDLSEVQDRIEADWGIRPYRATLLRHASNFYENHHIPLFYKTDFETDKYKLNDLVTPEKWQEFFKPKPKGRPRKYPIDTIDDFQKPNINEEANQDMS